MTRILWAAAGAVCLGIGLAPPVALGQSIATGATGASEQQAMLELRNTVVNLLQGLVQRGVLSEDDARKMVADAQSRAQTDVAALRAQEKAEEGAVRVTYVPETVKDEIAAEVAKDVAPAVVDDVVARAKDEGWGVPGALPSWVRNLDVDTRLRVRGQGDYFDDQNAQNTYLNFNAINKAGGIGKAGPNALLNTTEDRARLRGRLRVDVKADVAPHVTARFGVSTGVFSDPISMNETYGNYGQKLNFGVHSASIEWKQWNDGQTRSFDLLAGRFDNPFMHSSLIWDEDLAFDGVVGTIGFDVFRRRDATFDRGVWLTLGAFPVQEVELTQADKWLYAGQIGLAVPIANTSAFRFGAAYYAFKNITGLRNAPDSTLNDYTAPLLLLKGNTLFDIRNDLDPSTNLFALASDYALANVMAQFDFGAFGKNRVQLTLDYVDNRGFDAAEVEARVGQPVAARTKGREVEISVGRDRVRDAHEWRAFGEYRYVERDAMLDAFTDSDFALGGTDNQGFIVGFELGLTKNTWLTTRWFSSTEIDGPPLSIDVLQIDWNTRF
jgi:polyhydroxyalkanoate synthesis regulator phasin